MHILLVEDEIALANEICQSLRQAQYAVSHLSLGKQAIIAAQNGDVDLIILDLGLPDIDGLDVIKKIRSLQLAIPILVLTARGQLSDKINGLDAGADDYLPKPFALEELLARLRVLQRRLGTVMSSIIEISQVSLNINSMIVTVNDTTIQLRRKEFMVLRALMERANRIVSKAQLESMLYEWGHEVSSNAIEVHVHNLRKKLPDHFITNIRGVGYCIPKSEPAT